METIQYLAKVARLHFVKRILRTRAIPYKSQVRPILQYGAVCWYPCEDEQIRALDRIQNRGKHVNNADSDENNIGTLTSTRERARLCALLKAYVVISDLNESGEI